MNIPKLKEIHKHSQHNASEISQSSLCGCFFCKRFFSSREVVDFLDEVGKEDTAICPYCGMDSVLGSACGEDISKELLEDMYGYWYNIE